MKQKEITNIAYYFQFHAIMGYYLWMLTNIEEQKKLSQYYEWNNELDQRIKFAKSTIDELISQYKFKGIDSKCNLVNDIKRTFSDYEKLYSNYLKKNN